ncbi:MAG: cell division protein ZapB [Deltaproteobacteria bacterium]|nr:cell division protein ZapB [Deltaproteobacteria bacterium]MBW2034888.1 cell division protein ZapB [Deltaproteobacteria bacterium]MBW2118284.1 cell division protein ZapB [Deltaproteobacteria bacterium]MBW2343626.1 cell division protein ZapB [Deltaproteobacteria bacterium]
MDTAGDIDQFQLLEAKIDNLIEFITVLKKEKESIVEKAQIQEEKIADLIKQLESLKAGRDSARQRIVSLLEKIESIGI